MSTVYFEFSNFKYFLHEVLCWSCNVIDQTFDISVSDGGASVILGDRGIGSPKLLGGREHGLQENYSIIRVSNTIFRAF